MGILKKSACLIATLGPIGYLPAPGTCGTICAALSMYALRSAVALPAAWGIVAIGTLIAFLSVHYALPQFRGHSDPSQVVIDEYIGFAVLACTIPVDGVVFAVAFLFFRFFDIVKPLGIKKVEHLPGALGIMGDDLVAALYAVLCLQGALYMV